MGKGMRLWHLTGLPLQMVIPDHPRRVERLVDIAGLQQPAHRLRPDPAQAIGLQFEPHPDADEETAGSASEPSHAPEPATDQDDMPGAAELGAPEEPARADGAQVVSLDAFRKKT